jgi:mutator protein MutT
MVGWSCQLDDGNWAPYTSDANAALEAAFGNHAERTVHLWLHDDGAGRPTHLVDLQNMVQINLVTHGRRLVRRDAASAFDNLIGHPSSHASHARQVADANEAFIVQHLQSMGFSDNGGVRAARATQNASVEAAVEWAIAHAQDADFDDAPLSPPRQQPMERRRLPAAPPVAVAAAAAEAAAAAAAAEEEEEKGSSPHPTTLRLVVAASDYREPSSTSVLIDLPAQYRAAAAVAERGVGRDGCPLPGSGCPGVRIAAILPREVDGLIHPSGVFTMASGAVSEPLALAELKRGLLLHSDWLHDDMPLPYEDGGPLVAWFGVHGIYVPHVISLTIRTTDSVAVIAFDANGRALILQRGVGAPWLPGKWNLPGGGIDAGESAKEAAIREIQEETGLTPLAPWLVGDFEYEAERRIAVFVAESCGGALDLNFESDAHAWVVEAELERFEFVPAVEDALRRAFAARGHVRQHEQHAMHERALEQVEVVRVLSPPPSGCGAIRFRPAAPP